MNFCLCSATNPSRKRQTGRKPCEVLLMFRILILQDLYNVSDDDILWNLNGLF